jgi:hypothetical protein
VSAAVIVVAVGLTAAGSGVGGTSGEAGERLATFPIDAATLASIRATALRVAESNDEPHPSEVRLFATTRRAALAMMETVAPIGADDPVYVVSMRGNFVAHGAPRPPRARVPTGIELHFVWDRATRTITDFGVWHRQPNLAPLGHGVEFDLG